MENTQPIFNFYEAIRNDPGYYRQLVCGDLLMTEYTCPLDSRMQAIWSQHNYFVYVLNGRKTWHTADGTLALEIGSCAFVRKGAAIVEQFFDVPFCLILFFVPDDFIWETLYPHVSPLADSVDTNGGVAKVDTDVTLSAFFHSMLPYFSRLQPPDKTLLELKFRELLLNIISNPKNRRLMALFLSRIGRPSETVIPQVMEDNFRFNLSLETYAQLCNRSLSTFKRDFLKQYGISPGKWLTDKRLNHARMLLAGSDQTVGEIAYASGFENLSHFSRIFREKFGFSPIALRQQSAT